jgi:hypothetical protein
MNLFKRIRLLQTVRNGIIQYAAVVAPPGLKLCNPYFLISETNGRNASMNNSTIRVFNMKREITLFNLPQLRYTTSIKYMFIVHFALLFYIVHCCIDIEDRSLSGLYFNKIILSYLILIVYESGIFSFRNSKRSLHLVKFLFNNNKYFSKVFNWIQVAIHSGYDDCISVAIYVSFTFRNSNRHIIRFENRKHAEILQRQVGKN